jgi:hypothetical protein
MNDEQLIWEAYENVLLPEEFEMRQMNVLTRFLRSYHKDSRVVITNQSSIGRVNVRQIPQNYNYWPKPKGMWYALSNAWADFIINESPSWAKDYANVFTIQLDYNKVLKIDSEEKIVHLHKEYGKDMFLDWKQVQNDGYSGIEIIPYQDEYRHEFGWYYSWDIPSGCIWNSDAVLNSTKVYPRVKNQSTQPEETEEEADIQTPHQHKSEHIHKSAAMRFKNY